MYDLMKGYSGHRKLKYLYKYYNMIHHGVLQLRHSVHVDDMLEPAG